MRFDRSFYGSNPLIGDFKIGATLVPGQPCIWLSGGAGEVTDPAATTDLTNAMGLVNAAAFNKTLTYSTTLGDTEGVASVIYDPFAVIESRVVRGATSGQAYADADGYLLTETTGDTNRVTISDTQVGGSSSDANDGRVFALTGANAGQSRIITAMTANTSIVVTVPFANNISIGDTFLFSQYAPGVINVQMTSDFLQLDGSIAGATGGEAVVVNVFVETRAKGATYAAPQLYCEFIFQDHAFNSLA